MPSIWKEVALGNAAAIFSSGVDKHVIPGEESVRLCNYLDVYRNRRLTKGMEFSEGSARPAEIARFSLRKGDLVITKNSETPDDIGIPALVADDLDGVICGYHLALIRPRSDVTLSEFLLYYLQSDSTKRHFLRTAAGLTRFGLGSRAISSLPIPVPLLGEQAAIAQLLDAVDKALEQSHVAVNRARQLHISALSDAFERVKSVPRRLGEFTSDVRYGTSQASNARSWGNPTLRIPNVVRDQLSLDDVTFVALRESEIERLKLRDGDLLLVRTNGNPDYVGRSVVFRAPDDKTWIYASYLIRVRFLPGLSPDYVNAYLGVEHGRRELLRRVTTSAGNHNINSNSIRLVSLPVPDDPQDQHQVVVLAQSTLNYIRVMERKAAALTMLKRSLVEDLLTGRVRVKSAAEAVAA